MTNLLDFFVCSLEKSKIVETCYKAFLLVIFSFTDFFPFGAHELFEKQLVYDPIPMSEVKKKIGKLPSSNSCAVKIENHFSSSVFSDHMIDNFSTCS